MAVQVRVYKILLVLPVLLVHPLLAVLAVREAPPRAVFAVVRAVQVVDEVLLEPQAVRVLELELMVRVALVVQRVTILLEIRL